MSLASLYIDTMMSLGLGNMFSRAVVFAGLGFSLQYFIKPSISYASISTKQGGKHIAKEFSLTSKASSPAMTTYFPWYFWPISFMLLAILFL